MCCLLLRNRNVRKCFFFFFIVWLIPVIPVTQYCFTQQVTSLLITQFNLLPHKQQQQQPVILYQAHVIFTHSDMNFRHQWVYSLLSSSEVQLKLAAWECVFPFSLASHLRYFQRSKREKSRRECRPLWCPCKHTIAGHIVMGSCYHVKQTDCGLCLKVKHERVLLLRLSLSLSLSLSHSLSLSLSLCKVRLNESNYSLAWVQSSRNISLCWDMHLWTVMRSDKGVHSCCGWILTKCCCCCRHVGGGFHRRCSRSGQCRTTIHSASLWHNKGFIHMIYTYTELVHLCDLLKCAHLY